MKVNSAAFVISNTELEKCPAPTIPEYAFIGRSNVGKSSLINMLTNTKKLAKTSGTPGKTQLINHFLINEEWYIVDLPGYGYAKTSKKNRKQWGKFIEQYLLERKSLMNTFVLIDSRLELQTKDLDFMKWCAENQIPFSIVFTKTDKLSSSVLQKNMVKFQNEILQFWEEMPPFFTSSSVSKIGQKEILKTIEQVNDLFVPDGNT
jgi:GTP-binding protein